MHTRFASLLLIACLPLAFAACGDDDDDGGGDSPQVFEVEVSDDGVTAPESVTAGAVEFRVSNTGKRDHLAQVVAVGDGHDASEISAAGEAWGEEGKKPLPDWISFVGGSGNLKGGTDSTATLDLEPGEYAVFDLEGDEAYAEFTVEDGDGADLPEADATVEAVDYSFEATGLKSGTQTVRFDNAGEEPHHLIAAPLQPGKTIEDVKKSIESDSGPPPIDESKTVDTAILSGGTSEIVELDLQAGDYALVCFIPDRAGGPPHALKGMISAASVE